MNRTLRIVSLLLMSVAAVSAVDPVRAADIGTAFTYQGSLENGGCPVTDTCNFEFSLWDGPDAVSPCDTGMQIGSTDSVPGVMVTGGIFTVIVDFGVDAFNGTARWLRIEVQCTGDSGFTPLCPRQELTAAPYSLQTRCIFGSENCNVGIGTNQPGLSPNLAGARALTINGGSSGGSADQALALLELNGLNTTDTAVDTSQIRFLNNGTALASIVGGMANAVNLGYIRFVVPNADASDSVEIMRIKTPGRVGIGTTNPEETLHVYGNTKLSPSSASSYALFSTTGGGRTALFMTDETETQRVVIATNTDSFFTGGKVGIGTTTPVEMLHVVGGGVRVGPSSGSYTVLGTTGGGRAAIVMTDETETAKVQIATNVESWFTGGNVGIGTTTPSEKLQVCGSVKVSGSYLTGGCDVAEAFELSEREMIEPGMVMVLDPDRPGHLRISTRAYDTKVAGIVSGAKGTRPGILLGGSEPRASTGAEVSGPERFIGHRESAQAEACDSPSVATADTAVAHTDLPVALSGRVYCLVDATKRAVKVGDLLTTSDTPGYAMKVTNFRKSQGAVLGKAMEPLAKGEKGLILVLVGLQ